MTLDRRGFLVRAGLLGAGSLTMGCDGPPSRLTDAAGSCPDEAGPVMDAGGAGPDAGTLTDWTEVRGLFDLAADHVHLAGLLLSSHPRPVREAIERHRAGLDRNPVLYLREQGGRLIEGVLSAASRYLGVAPAELALTDGTTMGLGLLYHGLALGAGDDVLTTTHDHFVTHESLRQATGRAGATLRQVTLAETPATASIDEIVSRLSAAILPTTRLVAVTWVHSSTGLRLPIAPMAEVIASINATRAASDRILFCVDGVHGLGVEDVELPALGCDFFVAGTHKWLFGPRGTGFVWGRMDAWSGYRPTIPPFAHDSSPGALATPGGFHSFEHRWALAEAFELHLRIGKARVAERIHALNRQLKAGLAALPSVRLHTPMDDRLSAGLTCFEVQGRTPSEVVARLLEHRVIASVTPYASPLVRLTPGLLNTPEEIDQVVALVAQQP